MKTEISYENLVSAYAPLWDASRMIERLKEKIGGDGFANEFITAMEFKLESTRSVLEGPTFLQAAQGPLSGVKRKFELNFLQPKCVWPLLRYSGPSFHYISSDSNYRSRPRLCENSATDSPQKSPSNTTSDAID